MVKGVAAIISCCLRRDKGNIKKLVSDAKATEAEPAGRMPAGIGNLV
jgi:hypothetical protein